jgi:hypothetical protein
MLMSQFNKLLPFDSIPYLIVQPAAHPSSLLSDATGHRSGGVRTERNFLSRRKELSGELLCSKNAEFNIKASNNS